MTSAPRLSLSRKGFDSDSGGGPSPILPCGRMLSLPIPAVAGDGVPYARIPWGDGWLRDVMQQLGYSKPEYGHLDPDLCAGSATRAAGWRGLFGQSGSAAGHLRNQGFGPGDLFLFFGLFKQTKQCGPVLRFTGTSFHAVWGYLEVDAVLDAGAGQVAAFAPDFPHFGPLYRGRTSDVYVAREYLSGTHLPGYGTFRYTDALRLSAPDRVSDWLLPACAGLGPGTLSYHPRPESWTLGAGDSVGLRTAGRGQEFCSTVPALYAWARRLITNAQIVSP